MLNRTKVLFSGKKHGADRLQLIATDFIKQTPLLNIESNHLNQNLM